MGLFLKIWFQALLMVVCGAFLAATIELATTSPTDAAQVVLGIALFMLIVTGLGIGSGMIWFSD